MRLLFTLIMVLVYSGDQKQMVRVNLTHYYIWNLDRKHFCLSEASITQQIFRIRHENSCHRIRPPRYSSKNGTISETPKKRYVPDFRASAITTVHRLFPKFIINTSSAAVRVMMKMNQNKRNDAGNILTHSEEPLRVYGKPPISTSGKNIGLALFAGAAVVFTVLLLTKSPKEV